MTQQIYLNKLSYSPIHDVTERIDHQVKSDIDGQGPPPWLVCRDSCTNSTTQSSSGNTQNLKFGFGFIVMLNNETYGCHSKLCIPSIYFC